MNPELLEAINRIATGIATMQDHHVVMQNRLEDIAKAGETGMRALEESVVARLDVLETAATIAPSVPGLEDKSEQKKFSISRFIVAVRDKDWTNAPYEHEVYRAMNASQDTKGGVLVPSQLIPDFIPLLRSKLVLARAGVKILPNLKGSPVDISKQTGGASAGWVSEIGAIPDAADPTLGMLQLTPHKIAAIAKLSNSMLLRDNIEAADQIVMDDLASVLARKLDLAGLRGGGTVNEPVGIINTPGILSVVYGTNGLAPTLGLLQKLTNILEDNDALDGTLGWITSPAVRQYIEINVKDGQNRPIFQNMVDAVGKPGQQAIFGYPVFTTTQVPKNLSKGSSSGIVSEIYFANWADMIMGEWGGLRIDATGSTTAAFQNDQTWIRVIQEVDFGLRHEESFAYCADSLYA